MCGRFALPMDVSEIVEVFATRPSALGGEAPFDRPRYNICPTQPVLTVRAVDGGREIAAMRWGFLPHWYKAANAGPLLINARAETIAQKPAFREACRMRRCIVPATGFYEWRREGETKTPFFIATRDSTPLSFAAIWQAWQPEEGERIETCAIVTCTANDALAPLHHRMPVILAPEDRALWLGEAGHGAATLMRPAPEDLLVWHEVGKAVNAARSDAPTLMEPVA